MMKDLRLVTREVIQQYGLQRWFGRVPCERPYAWDALKWIDQNFPREARILELGCGIGQNLAVLSGMGFQHLYGIESDIQTFRGARELCEEMMVEAQIVCGDAQQVTFHDRFDVALPWNWTYQKGVDIPRLLQKLFWNVPTGGHVIIDIIDASWPAEQSPEYAQRFSRSDVDEMVKLLFDVVKIEDYHPRKMYYLRRSW